MLDVRNAFKKEVEDIFSNRQVYNSLQSEVFVLSGVNQQPTSFPCIYVDISDSNASQRYSSSTQIQRYTDFTLTFDIYSKDLKKLNQDDAVIKISEILIKNFQQKFHCLIMQLNRPLPNLDQTVSRWQIRFDGTYDNETNNIYSE